MTTVTPVAPTATLSPAKAAILAYVLAVAGGISAIVTAVTQLKGGAQAAGIVGGVVEIGGVTWKFLDTHDKHFAAQLQLEAEKAKAWVAGNVPLVEGLVTALTPVVADIPGLPGRLTALESSASKIAADVSAGTGIDINALAEAVKAKLVAQAIAPNTTTAASSSPAAAGLTA